MSDIPQIRKTIKHRLHGMSTEATSRTRYGLQQQLEELGYLFDMLERQVAEGKLWDGEKEEVV
jgi:hypothetical protein|tara:strand:- start:529 stop:717 length:189 start_codon:yes stop_codon:yes gene_type:complete